MSRLPPVPPASKSVYGPDGSPKTSVDVSHRVRHLAQKAERAGSDAGRHIPAVSREPSNVWMLAATGAVVAAIVWLAGQRRGGTA